MTKYKVTVEFYTSDGELGSREEITEDFEAARDRISVQLKREYHPAIVHEKSWRLERVA